jgi:D-amino-acid dehydrogenase
VLWPLADPQLYRWLGLMLRNCNTDAYAVNKARMIRLAEYSRDCLRDLRAETGISYDERQLGTLQLFRTQAQLDHVHADTEVLAREGVPFELLDADGCIAREPALGRVRARIAGGLRLPGDETGDAFKFTQALARLAEGLGARFRQGVTIEALETEGDRLSAVRSSAGRLTADRFVLALGSYSPILLRAIGIDVPIYPVKGYSLTVPITDPDAAPVSTVMDETYKVGITRLGDRIRRRATLEHSLGDLFPAGGDLSAATFWTGLRPMTPDGTPIVGPTRYGNLFLDTGHGTLGWTMACGSGRLIDDLVSDRRPNIPHEDLAVSRYGG